MERMQIKLPTDARPLMFYYASGLDAVAYLKVELRKDDLDSFLAASPFAAAQLSESEKAVSRERGMPWWDVATVARFLSGMAQLPDARRLYILVNLDQPDTCTVYLNWWET